MKHTEFYTAPESWPQPPDEEQTLELTQQGSGPAKKKKKSLATKAKKKMSESLAGVTAAAVAVVMLSNSIPVLKDAFEDFPELPDFSVGEICPVCGTEECPYFVDGDPGLRISLDSDVTYSETGDLYAMPGFSVDDGRYLSQSYPCLFTDDGQRIVLRLLNDFRYNLPFLPTEGYPITGELSMDEGFAYNRSYTGQIFYGEDEKSPGTEYYVYAIIVYAPEEENPIVMPEDIMFQHSYVDFDPQQANYRRREIPGVSDAWLLLCSNLDDIFLQEWMTYAEVEVIEPDQTYDLGQTMRYTEAGFYCRDYCDEYWGGVIHHFGFNTDGEDVMHMLYLDFYAKNFSFVPGHEIQFNQVGWKAVFDRWRDLNEDAPETGHQVYFPMEEMNSVTVNGIEYDCYIIYTAQPVDDVNDYPWIWYYFVPKQEGTMAVVERQSISPERLQKLLETLDVSEGFPPEDILRHITLR